MVDSGEVCRAGTAMGCNLNLLKIQFSSLTLRRLPAGGLSLTLNPVISFIPVHASLTLFCYSFLLLASLLCLSLSLSFCPSPDQKSCFVFIRKSFNVTDDQGLIIGDVQKD